MSAYRAARSPGPRIALWPAKSAWHPIAADRVVTRWARDRRSLASAHCCDSVEWHRKAMPAIGEGTLKLPRRRFLYVAAGAAVLPALWRAAFAQAYPTRPVRLIV